MGYSENVCKGFINAIFSYAFCLKVCVVCLGDMGFSYTDKRWEQIIPFTYSFKNNLSHVNQLIVMSLF